MTNKSTKGFLVGASAPACWPPLPKSHHKHLHQGFLVGAPAPVCRPPLPKSYHKHLHQGFLIGAPAPACWKPLLKAYGENKGFTLIELLIAMAVMVMLTGAAVLSLRGPYEKVRMKNAIQQFELLDQRARFLAKKRGSPVWIQMNVESNLFSIMTSDEEPTASVKQKLGTGIKIAKAAVPGRFFENENITVQVSPNGETCSYAVYFVVGKQSSWLLVAGTTGQISIAPDESYVKKTLSQCSQ